MNKWKYWIKAANQLGNSLTMQKAHYIKSITRKLINLPRLKMLKQVSYTLVYMLAYLYVAKNRKP